MSRRLGAHRVAAACVIAGALGWVWAFLAWQAPGSGFRAPGLPLQIERFATRAFLVGLTIRVFAPREGLSKRLSASLAAACLLFLGAELVSAFTGLRGVQLQDPRTGAGALLMARALGGALLGGVALLTLRQQTQAPSPSSSAPPAR